MKLRPVAPEFKVFAQHFTNISGGPMSHEQIMDFAMSYLNRSEKIRHIAYLDSSLDGSHSEDELAKLWRAQSPRIIVLPATGFLEEIRSELRRAVRAPSA